MKVVMLSALRTDRLYSPGKIPGTHFCWRLSLPQRHSATETIMSMKNSNYNIGNRIRDVPARSAVPQQTAPPRAPLGGLGRLIFRGFAITHFLDTPHSVGILWTSNQPVAETSTWQHTRLTTDRHLCPRRDSNPQSQQTNCHRPTP
jgi:hypothetical protein